MATTDDVKTKLATVPQKPKTLQDMIQESSKELGRALPAHLNPERLVRIALTNIRMTPALANCTPASFLGSLFVLAQLGLEPIAGRAYLLPFKNRRKNKEGKWESVAEVQAIVGYKGLVDLFYRHDKAVLLAWGVVHENDDFDYEYGTSSFLKHKPAKKSRGAVVGYWVSAELKNGGKAFQYMSAEEAIAHGEKHSKTFVSEKWNEEQRKMVPLEKGYFLDGSPWVDDRDAMCLKTVLIQLAKLLPLSVELQKALSIDETSRDFRKGIEDATELPVTTNWDAGAAAIEGPADAIPTEAEVKK